MTNRWSTWRTCGRRYFLLIAFSGCLLMAGPAWAEANRDTSVGTTEAQAESIVADSRFHGGLVVQVGCPDTTLALSFARKPNVLVHGLVHERERLAALRSQICDAGCYGQVSLMAWEGSSLPYADGMVNLLVLCEGTSSLDRSEIERAVAPLGVVWTCRDGEWTSRQKSWPATCDEWSHVRYDATGNAVSKDKGAGPPRYLQWEALPRWNRGVKTSSLVTTQGRLYFILDDSHFATRSPTWSLIARDAANGIQLWRRPLESWGGARGGKKVGPAQVNRRLVADDEHVFVTLAESAPVSVLDAATGKDIRTLEQTRFAKEFILSNGVLVVLVNPNTSQNRRRGIGRAMRLVAADPETGRVLWKHSDALILPLTTASDGEQVVYHDGKVIKSLDLKTGAPRWTSPPTGQKIEYRDQAHPDSPGAEKSTIVLAPQFAPTLIIYNDVVAFAGGRQLNVVSAVDGRELWRSDYAPSNYSVPVDLFGYEGALWGPKPQMNMWRPLDDNLGVNAYDLRTGKIQKSVEGSYAFRFQHHRCHQMKMVDDKMVMGRAGIEFLDLQTGEVVHHHWTRGSCYYGVLPANGRLYVPPHDCACYVRAKLSGFLAMNAKLPLRPLPIAAEQRLQRGPAYGTTAETENKLEAGAEDWPTLRHDVARSGRASTPVDSDLLLGWERKLGGTLSSPVIVNNRLFVASIDAHRVYSLDAETGAVLWQSETDARVDSPPTYHEGLVLFGCHDGSVQALRATDGALVWRFRACPEERLIVSRGQLESVWPVHGSVLVMNDLVYFVAGRSSYLDGGIRLFGLEPHTGRTVVEKVISTRQENGSEVLDAEGVDGCLSDVLSSNGERLFMRHTIFDVNGNVIPDRVTHLHSPDGFLSSDSTTRLVWTYAPMYTSPHQGAFYDVRLSRNLFPSGRMLVEDDETIFGYGQNHYTEASTDPGGRWAVFAASKESDVPLDLTAKEYRQRALRGKPSVSYRWWNALPIQVRAMVQTEEVLFVAGPHGSPLTSKSALDGEDPASLLAIDPKDGHVLVEMLLPATPVWDGLAAAAGQLFVTLANGEVLCLWSPNSGRTGTPLSAAGWRASLPPVETDSEPGLLGHWRFDEGTGMVARDCSPHQQDAVVSSHWEKSEFGTCLAADGVPRAAVIPDAPHLQFGNEDFTLAFWIRVHGYDARLFGKEAFPENWWVVNLLNDGRAELVLGEGRGPNKTVRAATAKPLPTDAWCHLVVVVDRAAREVHWYFNGKPDGRASIPQTMGEGIHGKGRDISIPSAHKPFRGMMGDFRIYGKALTAERVNELFQERQKKARDEG